MCVCCLLCFLPSRLACWRGGLVGGGGGFAPSRWLAPAVFPLPAARWVALLAGGVPSVAYVGFSSSSLAWLLAARLPLAFPRGLFLSLCLCFYYTIVLWQIEAFFRVFLVLLSPRCTRSGASPVSFGDDGTYVPCFASLARTQVCLLFATLTPTHHPKSN